ncbi:MAG: 50S ribosomal protein L18 [Parcubacteria group bacterium SW_4_49_11]|nr:MAG: 50S ribosomal protein L18 [Parcubacteria group bacterium SW_4_49_11]
MKELQLKRQRQNLRRHRARGGIIGTSGKPRLSVFRSNRYVYCQLIDDLNGVTMVGVHSKSIAPEKNVNTEVARTVGTTIAERAQEQGVKRVVFDRGSHQYEGNLAALADAAREAGLKF